MQSNLFSDWMNVSSHLHSALVKEWTSHFPPGPQEIPSHGFLRVGECVGRDEGCKDTDGRSLGESEGTSVEME